MVPNVESLALALVVKISERVILLSEQINVKKYSWKLPFHGASLWNKVIFGNS